MAYPHNPITTPITKKPRKDQYATQGCNPVIIIGMRLITLNIWGGRNHDPLLKFIEENRNQADIFCFQEVFKSDRNVLNPNSSWSNILEEIQNILPDFKYYFAPTFHGTDFNNKVDYPLSQGQSTFWNKKLAIKEKGAIFVNRRENDMGWFDWGKKPNPPKNFLYTVFSNFLVINFHGYWEPAAKYDTPQRFKQSQMIIEFIKKYQLPTVIAGDFNLAIDTKALLMFEEAGFRNLVKESHAPTTRSSLYEFKWRSIDPFADYIVVSKDIAVYDFKVLPDEISDHLPLYLEFEV